MTATSAWLGRPRNDLDTPALLIDLPTLEANIERMRDLAARAGVAYRPHAKTHKLPLLAHKQLAAGARGICCAKLGEAEVMVAGGVPGLLVTSQVSGRQKMLRLMAAARHGDVMVVVDNARNVGELSEAAQAFGIDLGVVVEIDIGQGRCGVAPGAPALDLVREVGRAKRLVFRGLQGYQGKLQMIVEFDKRQAEARAATGRLLTTAELVRKEGFTIDVLTGGGTGTALIDAASPAVGEIQPGSYVFMDVRYASIQWDASGARPPFGHALSILATVVSRPARDRAVVDVGWKAASNEYGVIVPKGVSGAKFEFAGDEHGQLLFDGKPCPLEVGDKVEFYPSHCDTTVNLYDRYFALRNETVEAVWEIAGRGKVQ